VFDCGPDGLSGTAGSDGEEDQGDGDHEGEQDEAGDGEGVGDGEVGDAVGVLGVEVVGDAV